MRAAGISTDVRVLATSIMSHDGVLTPDTTIKLDPSRWVLKHATGDEISLSTADFRSLSAASFTELEAKYG